ncbi:serine hydrolase [Aestuariibacter sp. A3R04]|uniref:serine hydrolase domain-containing protein n=1 Tax=Aestuariibacter sp. A3R04 TaxID=2841571 RepID=UPI001C0A5908|nr:serine hydrolase domain-containing protein [Aestuariibacter sp. A3R04]MBU3020304.1 beta-lactamase family protein [Aestuariibacter sp. A3R04]
MKPLLFLIVAIAPLLSFSGIADDAVNQELDTLFKRAVAHDTVPGITVAVGDNSGHLFIGAYGFADVENNIPMTPLHKVRIGSVSKLIATAGLMRLKEQNKIDLDAPIRGYAPAWPENKPTITLRQLTSHTAGIRHYKEGANEFMLNKQFDSINDALALFKNDPLLFFPGNDHSYSTFSWTLVSAAMEGADKGRNFRQIIEQEVFSPLKLENTAFDDQYSIIPHRARPYIVDDNSLMNAPQTDHSYKWAGGGFISTPSDIVKFAVAHVVTDYLSMETTSEMFTKAKLNSGENVNFGIGWVVGFDDYIKREKYQQNSRAQALMAAMPRAVMHSGGSMGGTTMTILCTEHNRAVTVVKNVSGDDKADIFLLALEALSAYHRLSSSY